MGPAVSSSTPAQVAAASVHDDTVQPSSAEHAGCGHVSESAKPPARTLRDECHFLWSLARPWRGWLLLASVCVLAQSALQLTMPWFATRVVQELLQERVLQPLLLSWFWVFTLQTLLSISTTLLLGQVGARMTAGLTNRLYDHVQALPLPWHQAARRGEVLALLVSDVSVVNGFLTAVAVPLLPLILTAAGALFLMLRIELRLAWFAAALTPMLVLVVKLMTRELRPLTRASLQARAAHYGFLSQNLTVLPLIKAFVREPLESARHRQLTHTSLELELRMNRAKSLLAPAVHWLIAAAVLGAAWLSATRIAAGTLTTPTMLGTLSYGLLLAQPISQLAGVWGQVQQTRGAVQRLMAAFERTPESNAGRGSLAQVRGDIVFEQVTFSHPGRARLYNRLDLHVSAGETVAIIGANGAGKSTLAHLLLRFADPDSGRILMDGVDLRDLSLRELRAHIGLVSQHVLLLNASVADNIRYGRAGATDAQVATAACAARADDFIRNLPQSYDTMIGDEGLRLSGGQRQRIALARALLTDPAILILDEATSMFDPDGEREVIAECRELLRTRTVLLITHRPASLALADRIIRIEDGRARIIAASTGSLAELTNR